MPVQRRPSGYVSRTGVPHDLRTAIGRREIVRNLKTGSSREAKRRAAEFEGHVAALFRRLRHLVERWTAPNWMRSPRIT